jgi:hypothetical protein
MATTHNNGSIFTMKLIAACARSTGVIGRFGTQKLVPLRTLAKAAGLAFMLCCAGQSALAADSWKEEVLLHDGQKIIVERSQTYGGRSEPGQSGPVKEHNIRFSVPGGSRFITWTSEYSQDIGRTNFNLLAVHVKDATPYIVAEPNLCLSYNKWGRPNPPYVFFKLEGDVWQRVALEQFPAEFTTINVAHNTVGRDAQTLVGMGTVPVEKVQAMNVSSNPIYRRILREALSQDQIIAMCGDMVPYKGRWVLRNDSIARKWIDREVQEKSKSTVNQ